MKTLSTNAALVCCLLAAFAACGPSSNAHTTGTNGSGGATATSGGANGTGTGGSGGSAGATSFTGMGTFTAMGSDAGTVSATMAPVITLSGSPSFSGSYSFNIGDQGSLLPSGGTLTFKSPSGITSVQLAIGIEFPGTAPTTGTFTDATANVCGTLSMIYSNDALTIDNNFTAGQPACPAGTAPMNTGSWSLTLSSLSLGPTMNTVTYYTAHGSLTASMIDGNGDTGSINLTF